MGLLVLDSFQLVMLCCLWVRGPASIGNCVCCLRGWAEMGIVGPTLKVPFVCGVGEDTGS